MMGLDEGWVTDHLDRRPALKALGNGVVPQQAAHALHRLDSMRCQT
jgi:DNA (cytosine-5)-methyltransferase 1